MIDDLEEDEQLQDAVLSVHHACAHTLQGATIKIVENHHGRGFFQQAGTLEVQLPAMMPIPQGPQPPPQPPS